MSLLIQALRHFEHSYQLLYYAVTHLGIGRNYAHHLPIYTGIAPIYAYEHEGFKQQTAYLSLQTVRIRYQKALTRLKYR